MDRKGKTRLFALASIAVTVALAAVLLTRAAARAQSVGPEGVEVPDATNLVETLPQVLSLTKGPQIPCGNFASDATMSRGYACECRSVESGETKPLKPLARKGTLTFSLNTTNDNILLGAWKKLGGKDGDDLGYTYGTEALMKYERGKTELGVRATSGLYTKPEEGWTRVPGYKHGFRNATMADVNRVETYLRTGRPFFLRGSLGYEWRRQEYDPSASLLTRASKVQDLWHSDILEIRRYRFLSPGPEDKVNPGSIVAGAGVGAEYGVDLFCACRATTEAGFQLSTEKDELVGPNSRAVLSQKLDARFGKEIGKARRYESGVGTVTYYYPSVRKSLRESLGSETSLRFTTYHRLSRRSGTFLSPLVELTLPVGHQVFERFNDTDALFTFGFRLLFE